MHRGVDSAQRRTNAALSTTNRRPSSPNVSSLRPRKARLKKEQSRMSYVLFGVLCILFVIYGTFGMLVLRPSKHNDQSQMITDDHKLNQIIDELTNNGRDRNDDHRNKQQTDHRQIPDDRPSSKHEKPFFEVSSVRNALLKDDTLRRKMIDKWKSSPSIAVVIFTYNRPKYLKRTVKSVIKNLSSEQIKLGIQFPLLISHDGYHKGVMNMIEQMISDSQSIDFFSLGFDYDQLSDDLKRKKKGFEARTWHTYHKISAHYRWLFTQVFDLLGFRSVILLEDDMEVSVDFFNYFSNVGAELMLGPDWKTRYYYNSDQNNNAQHSDSDFVAQTYCVSAWNDNGQSGNAVNASMVYRTQVFPGLGWMMSVDIWNEMKQQWTPAFWDDWMRTEEIRKGRSCVFPEMNRVYTFGEQGTSGGQFYKQYLKTIQLNQEYIDFSNPNVNWFSLVGSDETFESWLFQSIRKASLMSFDDFKQERRKRMNNNDDSKDVPSSFVVKYRKLEEYTRMAAALRMITDHKEGMPRGSYKGIVTVRVGGSTNLVHFVPEQEYSRLVVV